ncbi:(Fe-S)-binding protein [Helicobacter sp. 11S03491-1]|uniref:(Fe-S)-binding protein n=1 Tax=Helicobacter sp. 11S03491-1 TaxID=1476196 RepID=UPI000BA7BDCE|nr:(Fe-S)-binding protein [Helicobacter sp. 11S03491-1]PAF41824.1 oxidoreductase [Helicobacter sp. 11S03491-1]
MRVYFFATCLGSSIFSDTCINAVKLLQYGGAEVIFKQDQTCCGQPGFNSGYYEESKKIALFNIELFDKPYPIIVPSGSCAGMMKHDYIEMFSNTPYKQKAIDFAQRVYEASEFLVDVLKISYQDFGKPTNITWHSNCHALRVAKCIPQAKQLLKELKNITLKELEFEEQCCGFGGTFCIKEPEISSAMVNEKISDIQKQQVEYLISADAGCLMNISGAMKKQGIPIKTMHLYDFLIERTRI